MVGNRDKIDFGFPCAFNDLGWIVFLPVNVKVDFKPTVSNRRFAR
jgi:hypothetical protein